jgi:hypothetical protein
MTPPVDERTEPDSVVPSEPRSDRLVYVDPRPVPLPAVVDVTDDQVNSGDPL